MKTDTQIRLGKLGANVGLFVVLLMPLSQIILGCISTGASLLLIIQEPESTGLTILLLLFAYLLHAPFVVLLLLFKRFLGHCQIHRVIVTYLVLLVGLALSSIYFIYRFIPFPGIKFFPVVVYAVVVLPLLTLGLIGALKKARKIR